MKRIIIIGLSLLLTLVKSVNWCGYTKEFSCQDDETCCRGPSGWKCYSINSGKCCDDNLTVCQQNQKCDNENHKCI